MLFNFRISQLRAAALLLVLTCTAYPKTPCQSIAANVHALEVEIAGLQTDVQDWQALLHEVDPSGKAAIVAQIKKLQAQMAKDKADLAKRTEELATCQALAGSPTGGEEFSVHGGVAVSPLQVAHSIVTCAPE